MAKKKEQSVADQIAHYEQEIERERSHWNALNERGGNDPFWPDGTNMNLARNHIIYYIRQIQELRHESVQLTMFDSSPGYPSEMLLRDKRIPPLVDNNYMAPGHVLRARH